MYLIVSALILLFLLISISYKINIVQYEIKSEKIDRDMDILFLSDLHSCDYGINQKKLMDKIKSVDCDVILLGGDIVDDKLKPKKHLNCWNNCNNWAKRYTTFTEITKKE